MNAYPFTVLCRVMLVSRGGFCDYLDHFSRDIEKTSFPSAVGPREQTIFKQFWVRCGSHRIMYKLKADGHRVGRYKVRSLMRELGLKIRVSQRYKLTNEDRHSFSVAQNTVNRNFRAIAPNAIWTAGIDKWYTLEYEPQVRFLEQRADGGLLQEFEIRTLGLLSFCNSILGYARSP
jgi:putative transposase